jgi:transcriptional regulator with XRE-family HTH domain
VHDSEWFRRDVLPRLARVKLAEIAGAAGCSKASASDIRRGKWAPHVSTWPALADLVGVGAVEFVTEGVDTSTVETR